MNAFIQKTFEDPNAKTLGPSAWYNTYGEDLLKAPAFHPARPTELKSIEVWLGEYGRHPRSVRDDKRWLINQRIGEQFRPPRPRPNAAAAAETGTAAAAPAFSPVPQQQQLVQTLTDPADIREWTRIINTIKPNTLEDDDVVFWSPGSQEPFSTSAQETIQFIMDLHTEGYLTYESAGLIASINALLRKQQQLVGAPAVLGPGGPRAKVARVPEGFAPSQEEMWEALKVRTNEVLVDAHKDSTDDDRHFIEEIQAGVAEFENTKSNAGELFMILYDNALLSNKRKGPRAWRRMVDAMDIAGAPAEQPEPRRLAVFNLTQAWVNDPLETSDAVSFRDLFKAFNPFFNSYPWPSLSEPVFEVIREGDKEEISYTNPIAEVADQVVASYITPLEQRYNKQQLAAYLPTLQGDVLKEVQDAMLMLDRLIIPNLPYPYWYTEKDRNDENAKDISFFGDYSGYCKLTQYCPATHRFVAVYDDEDEGYNGGSGDNIKVMEFDLRKQSVQSQNDALESIRQQLETHNAALAEPYGQAADKSGRTGWRPVPSPLYDEYKRWVAMCLVSPEVTFVSKGGAHKHGGAVPVAIHVRELEAVTTFSFDDGTSAISDQKLDTGDYLAFIQATSRWSDTQADEKGEPKGYLPYMLNTFREEYGGQLQHAIEELASLTQFDVVRKIIAGPDIPETNWSNKSFVGIPMPPNVARVLKNTVDGTPDMAQYLSEASAVKQAYDAYQSKLAEVLASYPQQTPAANAADALSRLPITVRSQFRPLREEITKHVKSMLAALEKYNNSRFATMFVGMTDFPDVTEDEKDAEIEALEKKLMGKKAPGVRTRAASSAPAVSIPDAAALQEDDPSSDEDDDEEEEEPDEYDPRLIPDEQLRELQKKELYALGDDSEESDDEEEEEEGVQYTTTVVGPNTAPPKRKRGDEEEDDGIEEVEEDDIEGNEHTQFTSRQQALAWKNFIESPDFIRPSDIIDAHHWIIQNLDGYFPEWKNGEEFKDQDNEYPSSHAASALDSLYNTEDLQKDFVVEFANTYWQFAELLEAAQGTMTSKAWLDRGEVTLPPINPSFPPRTGTITKLLRKFAKQFLLAEKSEEGPRKAVKDLHTRGTVLHNRKVRAEGSGRGRAHESGARGGKGKPRVPWHKRLEDIDKTRTRRSGGGAPGTRQPPAPPELVVAVEPEAPAAPALDEYAVFPRANQDFLLANPLKEYQLQNIARIEQLALSPHKALIIADMPGCGKTISAVAGACTLMRQRRASPMDAWPQGIEDHKPVALIIAPLAIISEFSSTLTTWTTYTENDIDLVDGAAEPRPRLRYEQMIFNLTGSGQNMPPARNWVLITYSQLALLYEKRREPEVAPFFQFAFDAIIFDEAHVSGIFNDSTRDTGKEKGFVPKAIKALKKKQLEKLPTRHITVALTGTPIVNGVKDLSRLCQAIGTMKEAYRPKWWIQRKYVDTDYHRDTQYRIMDGAGNSSLASVRDLVPFLTQAVARFGVPYYMFEEKYHMNEEEVTRFETVIRESYGQRSVKGKLITGLTQLRYISSAYPLAIKHENYTKDPATKDIKQLSATKQISLSDIANLIKPTLNKQEASTSEALRKRATLNSAIEKKLSKFDKVLEIAHQMRADTYHVNLFPRVGVTEQTERKVIIFAEHQLVLEPLAKFLQQYGGLPTLESPYGTQLEEKPQIFNSKDKASVLEKFKTSPKQPYLLVSVKAGAAGLNIQHASGVIFVQSLYTAVQYRQALARAWRNGQTRDVRIAVLIPHADILPPDPRARRGPKPRTSYESVIWSEIVKKKDEEANGTLDLLFNRTGDSATLLLGDSRTPSYSPITQLNVVGLNIDDGDVSISDSAAKAYIAGMAKQWLGENDALADAEHRKQLDLTRQLQEQAIRLELDKSDEESEVQTEEI
jgi:superfamily II DNA or RNA helicase